MIKYYYKIVNTIKDESNSIAETSKFTSSAYDISKAYYRNGGLHRRSGPAVEYFSGYKEWWISGRFIKDCMKSI